MLFKRIQKLSDQLDTPFIVKLPDSNEVKFGKQGEKAHFQILVNNTEGLHALKSGNELKMAEAYMNQDIDLTGKVKMLDLLDIKNWALGNLFLAAFWLKISSFWSQQIVANKKYIAQHYELDPEFYLTFLDKTRIYSHGIFINDEEDLEQASLRKLEFMFNSCQLSPGEKVLDIGAGWGGATEFLGKKAICVDAITISNQSEKFISQLIQKEPALSQCQVFQEDFLQFQPSQGRMYDAIISLGTLEHLPNYKAVLKKIYALLKSGGYAYFDAASDLRAKTINSSFITRHIFPGNHKCLDLYGFLSELKKMNFELVSLHNDRYNYYLTLKSWAQNLEKNREKIVHQWGNKVYRKFQLYLWGCCHSMKVNDLQAHRLVLQKSLS